MLFPIVPNFPGVPAVARTAGAAFIGAISGDTLSVASVGAGILSVGQQIAGEGVALGTQITSLLTGAGAAGDYAINLAQNVASQAMSSLGNQGLPTIPGVTSDSPLAVSAQDTNSQWGLFNDDGSAALKPDSVVALDDFDHEFDQSTFPIELGSFSTYNKVAHPFTGRFIFNKGGSLADRQAFMDALETIVADTNLYVLSTPEKAYLNVNVKRYRYRRRSDNGFQLISVEITMEEIRVAASPQFSNTADPTGQSPATTGAVQGQVPTTAQTAQAQSTISTQGVGTLTTGAPPAPASTGG